MQIILWRHADAEDLVQHDWQRNLTPKGLRQADRMAAWLAPQIESDWSHWRVIASPANRAQQTARALQRPIETVETIAPDAPPEAVLDAVGWRTDGSILPDATLEPPRNVIVVGHQPTLGMVAAYLLRGASGHVSVRKGSMWWFHVRERLREGVHVRETVLKAVQTPDTV